MDNSIESEIIEELKRRFNGNARFNQAFDDGTFWYYTNEPEFPLYEVKYTYDNSVLKIEWESVKRANPSSKFMPPPEDGEAHVTMNGVTPPEKPDE